MMSFFRSWFLTTRFFMVLLSLLPLFLLALWVDIFLFVGKLAVLSLVVLVVADTLTLWRRGASIMGERFLADRLSNGEDNPVLVRVRSTYAVPLHVDIVDERPVEFQIRDASHRIDIAVGAQVEVPYTVHPVHRGDYTFGAINVLASTHLGLVRRRFRLDGGRTVTVYPSSMLMQRVDLQVFANAQARQGLRKVRRLGHTMEFEKIKHYVPGDDIRALNWKATARSRELMVNQFQDERSQDVYVVVDTGRVMRLPFGGLTLLDHAVNSTLAFGNIVLKNHDRFGLVTVGARRGRVLPARERGRQLERLNETLYNVRTDFAESDDARMLALVRGAIRTRSLLVIYTNIESRASLRRRLPYFAQLARTHLVVVVLFENDEIRARAEAPALTTSDIYRSTTAKAAILLKREIAAEFRRRGIFAVMTRPESLAIESVNAYLGMKARGLI